MTWDDIRVSSSVATGHITDNPVWIQVTGTGYARRESRPKKGEFGICVGEPEFEWIDVAWQATNTTLTGAPLDD